jgi:hypothetical protein
MAIWTLSHTPDADLARIEAALRRIDPTFRLHAAKGARDDFRLGTIPVRQAEGMETLQETVWDARFDEAWRGPKVAHLLQGLVDVIPGGIGESEAEVEKVYNPLAALPPAVRKAVEKALSRKDEAYEAALKKAKDMFATHGKAGTVVVDPFAQDPAERYRVMTEEEAAEAAAAMRADEEAAMKRADEVQDKDGRLPRPWEASWDAAVAPLTPVQAAIFRHLVSTQVEAKEFAMDARAHDAGTTLVAVAPAADPSWRGDIGSLVDALDMGLRVGRQTVLASVPVAQVTQDLAEHGIQRVPLGDLLDAAAAALADAPQA